MTGTEYVEYDDRRSEDIPKDAYVWPWQKHVCPECKLGFVIAGSYRGFNAGSPKCPECVSNPKPKETGESDPTPGDGSRWEEIA